jgi:hypothetical protein
VAPELSTEGGTVLLNLMTTESLGIWVALNPTDEGRIGTGRNPKEKSIRKEYVGTTLARSGQLLGILLYLSALAKRRRMDIQKPKGQIILE